MKLLWRMVLLAAVAGACALVHGLLVGRPPAGAQADEWSVAAREALAWPDAIWVDGRPASEYAAAHHPGALHMDPGDWEAGLAELLPQWEPSRRVVVYCGGDGCESSRVLAARLRELLGTGNVHWLLDGWPALQAAGGAP